MDFVNLQTMGYTYRVHQNLARFLCSIRIICLICVSRSHFTFCFIAVLFKSYAQTDHVYFSLSYDYCGSDVLRQHLFFGFCVKIHFSNEAVLRFAKIRLTTTSYIDVKMDKKYFDVNMVGALGYNSLSHYTSFTNESYMFTMKN